MKNRWLKILFIISLAANLLIFSGTIAIIQKKGGMKWVRGKLAKHLTSHGEHPVDDPYLYNKADLYNQLPVNDTDIIFFGDDIFEIGEWHELLGADVAKNRSLNGDITSTMIERIGQVIQGKPRHIVLLCGVNNFQKGLSLEQTTKEYIEIVDKILSGSENTNIWLIPVFPVNSSLYRQRIIPRKPWSKEPNQAEVQSFNKKIASLQNHPRVHFCEMSGLLNKKGELAEEYTLDGLHLNGIGFIKFANSLKPKLF